MKRPLPAVLLLLTSAVGWSKGPFDVAAPPAWVDVVEVGEADAGPAARSSSAAVRYDLVDSQLKVAGSRGAYRHFATTALNEAGLDQVANLSVEFDPAYQRLTIHGVWRRRSGQRTSVFDPSAVKVVQQERELDAGLYVGVLSALFFVPDVRVGDTIEFAYTVEGANPIFEEKFAAQFTAQYAVPIGRWRVRLLWQPERPLHYQATGFSITPTVRRRNGLEEYSWEQRGVPAYEYETGVPREQVMGAWLELTEHPSWEAVARWAAPSFAPARVVSPEIRALVERLRAQHQSLPARAAAAVRFVQDEIRYLGLELGVHSHRPHAPELVLSRRFGDCKDKALLLVTLLRALGAEADVALVSTARRASLDRYLPSPLLFDHAIVRAQWGGAVRWIDATVSLERGPPGEVPPPFARALLARADARGLEVIPAEDVSAPQVETVERWRLLWNHPAELTIETNYGGTRANDLRRLLQQTTLEELSRSYLKYYSRRFPRIRPLGPVSVSDDESANRIRTVERYEVLDVVNAPELRVEATLISPELELPDQVQRRLPLGIAHPTHLRHVIVIEPYETLRLAQDRMEISGPAFRMGLLVRDLPGLPFAVEYEYRTTAAVVMPQAMAQHLSALRRASNNLGYRVWTWRESGAPRQQEFPLWLTVLVSLGALLAVVLLFEAWRWPARLRARLRRKRFARRFGSSRGESPADAIAISNVTDMTARLQRMRCVCGVAAPLPPATEAVRYGERVVTLAKWTCTCGAARSAWFEVKESA